VLLPERSEGNGVASVIQPPSGSQPAVVRRCPAPNPPPSARRPQQAAAQRPAAARFAVLAGGACGAFAAPAEGRRQAGGKGASVPPRLPPANGNVFYASCVPQGNVKEIGGTGQSAHELQQTAARGWYGAPAGYVRKSTRRKRRGAQNIENVPATGSPLRQPTRRREYYANRQHNVRAQPDVA